MAKVVYNACHGGFSLSRKAVLRAREISGDPKWGGQCIAGDNWAGWDCDMDYGHIEGVKRSDPVLVRVVEELGVDANGDCAQLKIEDVPPGTAYRIDEYDGSETVMTCDDYQWEIAD